MESSDFPISIWINIGINKKLQYVSRQQLKISIKMPLNRMNSTPQIGHTNREEGMKMLNKGHQKIDCRVCSCEHHCENDVCDLDCICVQPMTGAKQNDAASQTLCGSYKCCGK